MTDNNWKLVDSFFDKYDLVDHHIKSYNDFVNNRIQKIIDISEPIVIENDEYNYKLMAIVAGSGLAVIVIAVFVILMRKLVKSKRLNIL